MVDNDKFFSKQKPAAVLKHSVFSAYVSVFMGMLGKRYPGRPLWLIDGYAGPGKYDADETGEQKNGSPLVALELALAGRKMCPPREVRCVFIEAEQKYAKELTENVKPFTDQGLRAEVHIGNVNTHLGTVWSGIGADSPVLTFIDPFGISAVTKQTMTQVLLNPSRAATSEVLVNINVEAISRHGGCLQWSDKHVPEFKPSVETDNGVGLSDAFFGGTQWRASFLEARERLGDANLAALEVVKEYLAQVEKETGAMSVAVPIRRTERGAMLFLFTLFYRHPAAAYKFADAAAKGTAKWREAFRAIDLAEWRSKQTAYEELGQGSLFDIEATPPVESSVAKDREKALADAGVQHIENNIRALLTPMPSGQGFKLAPNIERVLGEYMSLVGEPAIRRAWDNLAERGIVQPRDTSQTRRMWDLNIIKQ